MMKKRIHLISKFTRFVCYNSLGTLVDTLILWVLSHWVFNNYLGQYLISPFISFECAVFANYLCSWHFIWCDRIKQAVKPRFWNRYTYYNLSATGIFAVKMGFLLFIEYIFGWNVVACNLAALCLSGILNFIMAECVIFKRAITTTDQKRPTL